MIREEAVPKVKKIPGPNARRWRKFHERFAAKSTYEWEFIWDRGRDATGPFATDVDGNVVLDFFSHVASAPLGYNNPEIQQLMVEMQVIDPDRYAGADLVAGYGASPRQSPIPTPSHLQEKLLKITKKFKFGQVFLSNSGAEAVENAIKICYDNKKNQGYGFCFDGAFHGRTLGALSLNRSKTMHRKYYPQIPKIVSLPFCWLEGNVCCGDKVYTHKGQMTALESMLDPEIGEIDKKEAAFIILEPIQGEGGYNIPTKEFMKETQETISKYNIPFIVDEIQSGMGRTGKWWASEHFGLKPDIMTAGKALRVAATIGKKKMFPNENARISGTWAEGNAIASAVGCKTIEIIEKKHLLRNADSTGKYLRKRFLELDRHKRKITNVRGIGLMDAFEFKSKKMRDQFKALALKNGLLLGGCGYKSVRILPPLDVTKREIDLAAEIAETALKKVKERR